jgi:hypothetical protein
MTQPITNPNNLGYKVAVRTISWRDLCIRAWGTEFFAPDHGIYEFSGGRKFDSTDMSNKGLYNGGDLGE